MKRGGPSHPKTEQLQLELGIGLSQTVGILELLFHFAAQFTPDGLIGKFAPGIIAKRCDWPAEDADRFVRALVKTGWVDDLEEVGLYVHNWSDHCDDAVHMAIARSRKFFADGTAPKLTRFSQNERKELSEYYSTHAVHTPCTRKTHCPPPPSPALAPPCVLAPAEADAHTTHTDPAGEEKPKAKRFVKPTVDEVAAYCRERGNGIDPQEFIDSNDAKGWKIGKTQTPMKDWQAAIRTWESVRAKSRQQRAGPSPKPDDPGLRSFLDDAAARDERLRLEREARKQAAN